MKRWGFAFVVILGGLGMARMASADTLTALGLTLGLAFSLEAATVVGVTLAGPTIAALGQGMAGSIAAGGGIGAVNLAALGLVGLTIGIVGIAVVAGVVIAVVAPAIFSRSGPGPTAGAGASGEMTGDMATANAAANAQAQANADLAAAIASFAQNPPSQPTLRFSVNPTTGEVAITTPDGVVVGDVPGSPPGSSPGLGLGLTLGQVNDVNITNPSESPGGLPGIGEPAPGTDAVSVEASPDVGEYGWIDGVCRHYATGLSCAAYQEHEEDEYRHHPAVPSLATGWLMLLGSALAGSWMIRRSA